MATKKCPYCAEEIQGEAIVCKHCRSDLTVTPQQAKKKKETAADPNKALVMIVGIIALLICCWLFTSGLEEMMRY